MIPHSERNKGNRKDKSTYFSRKRKSENADSEAVLEKVTGIAVSSKDAGFIYDETLKAMKVSKSEYERMTRAMTTAMGGARRSAVYPTMSSGKTYGTMSGSITATAPFIASPVEKTEGQKQAAWAIENGFSRLDIRRIADEMFECEGCYAVIRNPERHRAICSNEDSLD